MAAWLNRSVCGGTAANGTTSHTCTFTAATSGSLLIAVVAGAVTSTTPTGWTLVGSAVNNGGLYVFRKVAAAGESSFTTTANGSNYAIQAMVYEFPSGSTVVGTAGTATGQSTSGSTVTGPNVTSLTGTFTRMTAREGVLTGATNTISSSWTTPATKDLDSSLSKGTNDGVGLTIAYDDAQIGTSYTPSSTVSAPTGGVLTGESVSWAVNVASSGGTAATGTASFAATATATGSVSASGTATLGITGTAAAAAASSGAGSVTATAATAASAAGGGTASLTFTGTATGSSSGTAAGTAAINFTATAAAQASTTGAAGLSVAGSAIPAASIAGSGTITVTGSAFPSSAGAASGSASVTFAATGASRANAGGSASLSVTATGAASTGAAPAAGAAAFTVTATGLATGPVMLTSTPPERTLTVPAESRVGAVAYENRTVTVLADPRVLYVT